MRCTHAIGSLAFRASVIPSDTFIWSIIRSSLSCACSFRLSRNEINAQIDNNNKLFTGTDGQGSHATVVIEDEATRRWVGFDTEDNPQRIFNDQMVLDMFAMKQSDYEDAVHENIQTRAEKYAFIEAIKKLKLNDYAKMVFASNYTGYKL